ncbi:MAG: integrase/recombinase XerD [Alphaproteobacteria bacterium]|jgi:integrase/recombinase XerD
MQAITCNKKVTDFLQSKSLQKNFSVKSIDAYRSDLVGFDNYLKAYCKILLEKSGLLQIEEYIAFLHDNQYQPSAITRKISAIRQFYKFLYLEGLIFENPARLLKTPKFNTKPIQPLSYNQIQTLLHAADNFIFPHNIRLKALIELAFGAGLRVTELTSIPFEAVNHKRDYTIIKGKGSKERLIPLTDIMKQAITDYLPYRSYFSNGLDTPYLFSSTGKEGYLSRVRFFQLLKELAVFANMDPQMLSPHVFRHSFALSLLRGGADLKSLQALLGHEKIDTVEIYTKVNNDDLWNMMHTHHPLEK